jgi:hypothetical protein
MKDVLKFVFTLELENVSFVIASYCETESLSFFENEINSYTSLFSVNENSITKSALGENQECMRNNLHAILVSTTARTTATMIRAASTTAAETPTRIFFVVDHLQYQ